MGRAVVSITKIQFPWFALVYDDDNTLVTVDDGEIGMVPIFTDRALGELYGGRQDTECSVVELLDLDEAIDFLEQISTADPTGESDHVSRICFDPIDPDGDEEGSAFEIAGILTELRKLNR